MHYAFVTLIRLRARQVMVVHVNPYDTGFEENSHVMRFSAIARQIQTTAMNKVTHPIFKGLDALRSAVQPRSIRLPVRIMHDDMDTIEENETVEEDFVIEEG